MQGGVRRSVRPIASRAHGGATGRSGLCVRMCVRDPRHRDRVQLEACAAERHPWGACSSGGGVRRRVRRAGGRAGGQWVKCARGSTQPSRRIAPCACCAAALPGFARSPRAQRLWASSLLGFRHTARRRLRRAVCGGVGSRGSLEPGAMEQRALRMPSPLLRRERARWWGVAMGSAPERGDGEGAVLSARRRITEAVTYLHFTFTPRLPRGWHPCRCSQGHGQCKSVFLPLYV